MQSDTSPTLKSKGFRADTAARHQRLKQTPGLLTDRGFLYLIIYIRLVDQYPEELFVLVLHLHIFHIHYSACIHSTHYSDDDSFY